MNIMYYLTFLFYCKINTYVLSQKRYENVLDNNQTRSYNITHITIKIIFVFHLTPHYYKKKKTCFYLIDF